MPELSDRRRIFAEKVTDLGNIAAGALVFGQFLSEKGFNWGITSIGIILLVFSYVFAYIMTGKEQE